MSSPLGSEPSWDQHPKQAPSPLLQALLHPDRPCLVPISPNTGAIQLKAAGSVPEAPACRPSASDASMSEQSQVKSGSSRHRQARDVQSHPYPLFAQRPTVSSRPAMSSSSFRAPSGDSDSDSNEEDHASSASFVVRTPEDASGELLWAASVHAHLLLA